MEQNIDCGFWAAKCLENGDMNGYDYWMGIYFNTLKKGLDNGTKLIENERND